MSIRASTGPPDERRNAASTPGSSRGPGMVRACASERARLFFGRYWPPGGGTPGETSRVSSRAGRLAGPSPIADGLAWAPRIVGRDTPRRSRRAASRSCSDLSPGLRRQRVTPQRDASSRESFAPPVNSQTLSWHHAGSHSNPPDVQRVSSQPTGLTPSPSPQQYLFDGFPLC